MSANMKRPGETSAFIVPYWRWLIVLPAYIAGGYLAAHIIEPYEWPNAPYYAVLVLGLVSGISCMAYPAYWLALLGPACSVVTATWILSATWWDQLPDSSDFFICISGYLSPQQRFLSELPTTFLYVWIPLAAWAICITIISRHWRRVAPGPMEHLLTRIPRFRTRLLP